MKEHRCENERKLYPRRSRHTNIKNRAKTSTQPTPHAEHKTFNLGAVSLLDFACFQGLGAPSMTCMNMTIHRLPHRMMPVDGIVKQNGNEEERKTLAHEICTVQVWHHGQSRPPPRDTEAVHLAVPVRSISHVLHPKLQIQLLSSKAFFSQSIVYLFSGHPGSQPGKLPGPCSAQEQGVAT